MQFLLILSTTIISLGIVGVLPLSAQPIEPQSFVSETQTDYVLGPGDQVAIEVLGYSELTGSRVILPDGSLSMPLIGSIRAAGKTAEMLTFELTDQLGEYLVNPVVNVSLTVLRPVVVNVAGDVYRPGPVQLSSLTQTDTRLNTNARITATTSTPTLAAALSAAGGIRRTADIRQVMVYRPTVNGHTETIVINLWEMLTTQERLGRPTVLRDGDSVYVPRADLAAPVDPRLVSTSSIAPDTVRVRVIGEVKRPGVVEVSPDSTVSGAVAQAGGYTDDAQLDVVALVRLNRQGQVEEQLIDLSNLVDSQQIQDGDVVLVAKKGYLRPIDAIGRIVQGIFPPFNLLNLFGAFD